MLRLTLGTANLENKYGFFDKSFLSLDSYIEILRGADRKILAGVDTAVGYGSAHQLIEKYVDLLADYDVCTKIRISKFKTDLQSAEEFRKVVKTGTLRLLIHDFDNFRILSDRDQDFICGGMSAFDLGVSIQQRSDFDIFEAKAVFRSIQIPFNILDQRFRSLASDFKRNETTRVVSIRSCFLQGFLLARDDEQLPPSLLDVVDRINKVKERWRNYLQEIFGKDVSRLELCLYPLLTLKWADDLVVGVTSSEQYFEIERIINEFYELDDQIALKIENGWRFCSKVFADTTLNPSLWNGRKI